MSVAVPFKEMPNFSPREAYPLMKISCKFGEPYWCSFPLRVLTLKISTRCSSGGSVANAKPKYPPDASGGYNYI